jgi:mannose-6-phosphate isomerase-like protein (cupin superfamily)
MASPISINEIEHTEKFIINHFSEICNNGESATFNLIHAIINPLCSTNKDQHKVRECWFITQGQGLLTLNDSDTVPVAKGQLFFFDSMISHQLYNTSSDVTLELLSVWW